MLKYTDAPQNKYPIMSQLNINHFDVKKAGQLVFFFMKKSTLGRMNVTKLRLIKWLYLAERASYEKFGEPMLGDRLGALQHGPVTSETLALIEGKSRSFPPNFWGDLITVDGGHRHQYVHLASNCKYQSLDDLDRFSESEIELLEGIWNKYGHWSATRLEKYLHNTAYFPEWTWKKGEGTKWIAIEDILKYVGFEEESIEAQTKQILAFYAHSE